MSLGLKGLNDTKLWLTFIKKEHNLLEHLHKVHVVIAIFL